MGKVIFITPKDAAYGFRLAGVDHYSAEDDEIEEVLLELLPRTDPGLVIVEESLMKNIPEDRQAEIGQRWQGILLTLPSPERPGIEIEDIVTRLIQRAIGYHMRLKL